MNHFYPHSGGHLFYRKRIEWLFLRLKVMEQDPLFVHLTAPTIVYATPRSSTTWQFVVVALVLLIFCTLNLTCSRRSDISREYGAKRRGAKKNKTQHNIFLDYRENCFLCMFYTRKIFANLEEKIVIVLLHLVWRRPENNSLLLALLPRDVKEIRDLHSDKNVHSTLRHGYIIRGPARLSFF